MNSHTPKILANWNTEADIWVATSFDIPGLVLGSPTKEGLVDKIQLVAADLLKANCGSVGHDQVLIDYIQQDAVPL